MELDRLPKLAAADLRLLWVNDWYDGPLEAVVEHAGARCLMVLQHEDLASEPSHEWLLFRLTPEQSAEEEQWHSLFVEHVGDHWCFHDASVAAHPPPVSTRDPERFREMFAKRKRSALDTAAVVGWTDEIPKR